jgi:hypothetical protein
MILGMSLATFTQFHVIISLIGIISLVILALAILALYTYAPAPTQKEPPFAVAQGVVLMLFIGLGVAAFKKFRPMTRAPVIA